MRKTALQIHLLGTASWAIDSQLLVIPDARAAVLVAMVAIDGPLPRHQVAEMFWPRSEGAARSNLRVLLHRLNRTVAGPLFASRDRVALLPDVNVDIAGTDAEIVERCLQLGSSNTRLLHGIEMDDFPEVSAWLNAARQQVQQRISRCLEAWLDTRSDQKDLTRATAVAESLVALNPFNEVGQRALMRVLIERGDRAGALAAFERCRHELYVHLGTQPDPQTISLHREILRLRTEDGERATVPSPRSLLQREEELDEIDRALDARRVVIVEGASGTGKTALLTHLARERGDFYWAADSSDGQAPLSGLLRLVHHIEAMSGGGTRVRKTAETLMQWRVIDPRFITAAKMPILVKGAARVAEVLRNAGHGVIIFDDIHLLDDISLDVLAQILNDSREHMPWCDFVLAYRPMRTRRKIRALCQKLAMDGRLSLIHPSALKRETVLQMLDELGHRVNRPVVADRIVAMSGGTPGVVVELLDSAIPSDRVPDWIPPQVRSILLERLHACSSTAKGIAQLASVAGANFGVSLATSIAGLSSWNVAEKWNELLLAGIFDARGFAFPLMEDAVRASIPDAVRQFMHGEVASALERHGCANEHLALHWRKAGDAAKAALHARIAAGAMLHSDNVEGAISVLEEMVFAGDQGEISSENQTVTLLQLAALYLESGQLDRMAELLDAAARLPASPLERGVCMALGGRVMFMMQEYPGAYAVLQSSLPLVADDGMIQRDVARWALLVSTFIDQEPNDGRLRAQASSSTSSRTEWRTDAVAINTPADAMRCMELLGERGVVEFHRSLT